MGPFIVIPTKTIVDQWLVDTQLIRDDGKKLSRRELNFVKSMAYVSELRESGQLNLDIIEFKMIDDLCNSQDFKLSTYGYRDTAPKLVDYRILQKEKYEVHNKPGRKPILYIFNERVIDQQSLPVIDEMQVSMQQGKLSNNDRKRFYSQSKEYAYTPDANPAEPWKTFYLGSIVDYCCSHNKSASKKMLTQTVHIAGEAVKVDTISRSQIMRVDDQRVYLAIESICTQALAADPSKGNKFAVDMNQVAYLLGAGRYAGGNRKTLWESVERIRDTVFKVHLDPDGNLAAEVMVDDVSGTMNYREIELLQEFSSGVDRNKEEREYPTFIEFSLFSGIYEGIITGKRSVILNPGVLTEKTPYLLMLYFFVKDQLEMNSVLRLSFEDLWRMFAPQVQFRVYKQKVLTGLTKNVGVDLTQDDQKRAQSLDFNFYGFEATLDVIGRGKSVKYVIVFRNTRLLPEEQMTVQRRPALRRSSIPAALTNSHLRKLED